LQAWRSLFTVLIAYDINKDCIMHTKKIVPVLLMASVLVSSISVSASAYADNHRRNENLAIAAGVLGAVAIGTMIANSNPAPHYVAPPPAYPAYPAYAPPPQVYVAPQPVYVRPAPVYAAPAYVAPAYRFSA